MKGQVFSFCAECGTTCAEINNGIKPPLLCLEPVCTYGCICSLGQAFDTANNECVEPEECPSKSSDLEYIEFSPGNKDDPACRVNRSISQQMNVPVSLLTWSI